MEHRASLSAGEREIERLEARRKKLIERVMEGVAPSVVKEELNANVVRREQLEAQLADTEEPPPRRWPGSTGRRSRSSRRPFRTLTVGLRRRRRCAGLVDGIVLTPDDTGEALQIELQGQPSGDARCDRTKQKVA